MNTLILSGWAQSPDALKSLFPQSIAFDYSDHATLEVCFKQLTQFVDIPYVVAWSMGGQLALRAIVANILKPKHLTLIGVPWQFIGTQGMDAYTYQLFRDTYVKNPARHKERFAALIAKGDRNAREVMRQIMHHPDIENTNRWLPWLEMLAGYSFEHATETPLPPALIIHGAQDAIVPVAQAYQLRQLLPSAHLAVWNEASHAPHWHDPARFMGEIDAHRSTLKIVV